MGMDVCTRQLHLNKIFPRLDKFDESAGSGQKGSNVRGTHSESFCRWKSFGKSRLFRSQNLPCAIFAVSDLFRRLTYLEITIMSEDNRRAQFGSEEL